MSMTKLVCAVIMELKTVDFQRILKWEQLNSDFSVVKLTHQAFDVVSDAL